jgi:acyl carrier protein
MDVLAKIQEIIERELEKDPEEITPDASLRGDLNADSIDLVTLVMEFEEELQTVIRDIWTDSKAIQQEYMLSDEELEELEKRTLIPDEDIQGIDTVGDAVDYIEQRIATATQERDQYLEEQMEKAA